MSDPRSGAVEFSLTPFDSPRVIGTVRNRLNEAAAEKSKHITNGSAKDWGEYQRRIGRLEGVRDALVVLDEVERENSQ